PARESWPELVWTEEWTADFAEDRRARLSPAVATALRSRSWFWGKSRHLLRAEVVEVIRVRPMAVLAIVQADYVEGKPERYLLPVAAALGREGEELAARSAGAVLARLRDESGAPVGVLYDAVCDRAFCEALLAVMSRRTGLKGSAGELEGWSDRQIRRTRALQPDRAPGQV